MTTTCQTGAAFGAPCGRPTTGDLDTCARHVWFTVEQDPVRRRLIDRVERAGPAEALRAIGIHACYIDVRSAGSHKVLIAVPQRELLRLLIGLVNDEALARNSGS